MGFDYNARITNVVNALKDYNSATSSPDLSANLTSRIDDDNIFDRDISAGGTKKYRMPCIYVRIANKQEDFAGLGATGITGGARKEATVIFEIVGLYQKEGAWSTNDALMDEVYNLGANIENVLRQELTLSGTALWCQPLRTDFVGPFEGEGIHVKGVFVELEAKYHFK